jgi:hypothetical protein
MANVQFEKTPEQINVLNKLKAFKSNSLFSIYWEIRTALYLGVLLFATGAGILIYKNIDSIGHVAILAFIGSVTLLCWLYCFKNSPPFAIKKVASAGIWFDYLLLLAALLTVTFIGYVQYQFQAFGKSLHLASAIPMVVLFAAAYRFDHIGVLTLAITNLGVWLGINVTPTSLLKSYQFNDEVIIYTGILLGLALQLIAWLSIKKDVKEHFALTYQNFGVHVFFISCLAAIFHFHFYLFWLLLLSAVAYFLFTKAIKEKSFYFLLIVTLYAFVALSFTVINLIIKVDPSAERGLMFIISMYFITAPIGLIFFLIHYNKKLKQYDNL